MSLLHEYFLKFDRKIKLTDKRKEKLNKSIEDVQNKILFFFNENNPSEFNIEFKLQGSLTMNTIINPIPTYYGLEYDIDCGVYFIGAKPNYSIDTLHNWISNATYFHTEKMNVKKKTAVRVMFSDGHHIDLPIYYTENKKVYLAHKKDGWIESNPVKFKKWFNSNSSEQLIRIVRYLKAWKNFREVNKSNLKLPSGFILTILAKNNYIKNECDGKSFLETIKNIQKQLDNDFKCLRPTTPQNIS